MTGSSAAARYTRQVRLAEVGHGGQERLAKARVSLHGSGTGRVIEERYLTGAGVTPVTADAKEPAATLPVWLLALDPAARDVAEGAFSALLSIKKILEQDRSRR